MSEIKEKEETKLKFIKDIIIRLKELWDKIPDFFKNKYIITFIVFFIWIFLFDPNNMIERFKGYMKIGELEDEKQYFEEKIQKDSLQLKEIKTDKEAVEKYAREKYYMKKKNEDIFIIVDEDENK